MTPIDNPEAGGAGVGLPVRRNAACAEVWYPAVPPAIVTSGAGAWTWGGWVGLGLPIFDFVVSYIHAVNYAGATALIDSTIELNRAGPPGLPLDAARELAPFFNPGPTSVWALPLSQMAWWPVCRGFESLNVRAANSSPRAYDYEVMVLGWLGGLPTFDTLPISTVQYGFWYPANTGGGSIASTSGAGWTFGASATVIDPAPYDMLVVGLEALDTLAHLLDSMVIWQVGYGPNLGETWCATIGMGRTWSTRWLSPAVYIKAGERLAVRTANDAVGIRACRLKAYRL